MRSNAARLSLGLSLLLGACGGAPAPPALPTAPAPVGSSSAEEPSRASNPGVSGDADVDRAVAAIKAADYASAKGALSRALRKDPKNGAASYYMGVALENTGDKPGAEQSYRDALASSPDLVEAAVNLGALYLDASRWDDAAAVTQHALSRRPADPALHANLAVALRGKGDARGAAAEYEHAIKASGDNADLRFAYGSLLLELGNKPKAAEELRAALRSAGENRALVASIGRLLGSAGAFSDCVSALDRAVSLGDDAELRVRRGLCRHSLHDEPSAKADFEAATKLDPKFGPAHYYLAEALVGAGNTAQALKEFDAAASAAPQTDLGKRARQRAEALRHPAKKRGS